MVKEDQTKVNKLLDQVPDELSELDKEDLDKWKVLAEIRELNKRFYQKPIQLLQITIPLLILGLTWIIKGGAIKEYLDVERLKLDRNRVELANKRDSLTKETTIKQELLLTQEIKLEQTSDSLEVRQKNLINTVQKINYEKGVLKKLNQKLLIKEQELVTAEIEYQQRKANMDEQMQAFVKEKQADSVAILNFLTEVTTDYNRKLEIKNKLDSTIEQTTISFLGSSSQDSINDLLNQKLNKFFIRTISLSKDRLREKKSRAPVKFNSLDKLLSEINQILTNFTDVDDYIKKLNNLYRDYKSILKENRINKRWGIKLTTNLVKITDSIDALKRQRTGNNLVISSSK